MRKEIVSNEVVTLKDIDNKSFVGIQFTDVKSLIVLSPSGKYSGLGTDLSLVSTWERSTKQEYVDDAIRQGSKTKAFVFDSQRELLEWFSK